MFKVFSNKSDYLLSLIGQFLRVVLQALFLFLLVLILSQHDFGLYSLLGAVSILLLPYSNLSSHILLVKNATSVISTFEDRLLSSQQLTLILGSVISVFATILFSFYTKELNVGYIWIFLFCELVIIRSFENIIYHFQAKERFDFTIYIKALVPALRCFSLLILWFVFDDDYKIESLILYYFGVMSIGYLIINYIVLNKHNIKYFIINSSMFEFKVGVLLSSSLLVYGVFASTDQLMIGYYENAASVAIYAFAAKIYFMAILPIQAVSNVTLKKFFNSKSRDESKMILNGVFKIIIPYAFISSIFIYLLSDVLIKSFLSDYVGSIILLNLFAIALPFKAISSTLSDLLVGLNLVKIRLSCEVVACVTNVALNFVLIPLYSLEGAVIATICSELILFILFFSVYYLRLTKNAVR